MKKHTNPLQTRHGSIGFANGGGGGRHIFVSYCVAQACFAKKNESSRNASRETRHASIVFCKGGLGAEPGLLFVCKHCVFRFAFRISMSSTSSGQLKISTPFTF